MTMAAAVKEQLQKVAGVSPSMHWLEDCLSALRISNVETASAAALEQILHHDLRDVVRTFRNAAGGDNNDEALSTFDDDNNDSPQHDSVVAAAAVQLRRAVRESQTGESRKAVLPETFRLLVQVEEFLDVSSNADTRMGASSSSSSPAGAGGTQNYNSNKRCFKFCFADGYCGEGNSDFNENTAQQQQQQPLVAMEVSPIAAHLTVNTPAGLKVLLTGPMTIRHGMVGWHAGNAFVLGGCVETLVQVQQQALQLARNRAGHGVDPTVKALIWSNQHQLQDDEEDEGGTESGDVPLRAPLIPHQQQQQQQHMPPPTQYGQQHQQQQQVPQTYRHQQHRHSPPPPSVQRSTIIIPQQQQQRPAVTSQQQQQYPVSRPLIVARAPPVADLMQQQYRPAATIEAMNPYASSSSSSSWTTAASQIPQQSAPQPQPPRPLNPYESTRPGTQSPRNLSQPPVSLANPNAAAAAATVDRSAAAIAAISTDGVGLSSVPTTTVVPLVAAAVAAPSVVAATPVIAVTYPYPQLRSMLVRAANDEAVYRQAYGKVYIVQMKQLGPKLHFNIDKTRSAKDKKKQHEYVMIAKYGGDSESDGVVTCKISSEILEPHFSLSPGEMRKLSRVDKANCEVQVREGGKAVQQRLKEFGWYELTLLRSPEEFFRSEDPKPALDGDKPVLYLISRRQ